MLFDWLFKKKRKPEADVAALSNGLQSALGDRLKSVVVFGSLASGEFRSDRSNVNVLVMSDMAVETLSAMGPALKVWLANGNLPPVLVDPDGLDEFARDFPIEFLDIKDAHRVLFGKNPLEALNVDRQHLKSQCEHDLALVQLRLRQVIASAGSDHEKVRESLLASATSTMTLFRAVVRLEENTVKLDKIKAVETLAGRVGFDKAVILRIKDLKLQRASDDILDLTAKYLGTIEAVLSYLRK